MGEDVDVLAELLFHVEQFCCKVETATRDIATSENGELRAKLGQCRTQLAYLQNVFNEDELSIENPAVRADFRYLVITLMWIAFHARTAIDFKIYRMLVRIESGFSYLLITRPGSAPAPAG